ncbi:MAG: 16S rRNA (guanine(527)-N(7))-methyltransferase RsmG [Oxalobacter sp.]|nr:MAG: 16S rRNA (guanine(527)-N(7))-methyltransferase RsmG [Oxalobacter sp.]
MNAGAREKCRELLAEGLQKLSLTLDPKQKDQLLKFLDLLQKWNGIYNLTAIRDPEQMVRQHLLDCLAILPAFELENQTRMRVLDVGSGGGLPGVILAIAKPEMQVSLIDTVHKKTAFLTQAKLELGLENVTVLTGRVEQYEADGKYDVITSRAFAELKNFIQLTHHLLKQGGRYIAMKAGIPEAEINQLPPGWRLDRVWPLNVPGLQAERHLILIARDEK